MLCSLTETRPGCRRTADDPMSAPPPSCMMTPLLSEKVSRDPHQLREFPVRLLRLPARARGAQPSALVWSGHVIGGAYNTLSVSRAFPHLYMPAASHHVAGQSGLELRAPSDTHPCPSEPRSEDITVPCRRSEAAWAARHARVLHVRRVPDHTGVCTLKNSHPSRVDHPWRDVPLSLFQAAPHSALSSDARTET